MCSEADLKRLSPTALPLGPLFCCHLSNTKWCSHGLPCCFWDVPHTTLPRLFPCSRSSCHLAIGSDSTLSELSPNPSILSINLLIHLILCFHSRTGHRPQLTRFFVYFICVHFLSTHINVRCMKANIPLAPFCCSFSQFLSKELLNGNSYTLDEHQAELEPCRESSLEFQEANLKCVEKIAFFHLMGVALGGELRFILLVSPKRLFDWRMWTSIDLEYCWSKSVYR